MEFLIKHNTTYKYSEPVSLGHNIIKLWPREVNNQHCVSTEYKIYPQPTTLNEYLDFFGNRTIYFSIDTEHEELVLDVISRIRKNSSSLNSIDVDLITVGGMRQLLRFTGPSQEEARPFVFETPMTRWNKDIHDYAAVSFYPDRPVFEATKELVQRIYNDFSFSPGFSTVATPLEQIMKERKGVCQDFAHLGIACLRSMGLAARYVSGYIETLPVPGIQKLIGVDASHAWFAVYIGRTGWVDFDPTNNQLAGQQHITIGWGREYADIAPVVGVIQSSGKHELLVSVDVQRV